MTLWFCAGDLRAGRLWRWLSRAAALYAYSPIDLIPDFIPVLGYVDDVLLLPGLIWLAIRLTPSTIGRVRPARE